MSRHVTFQSCMEKRIHIDGMRVRNEQFHCYTRVKKKFNKKNKNLKNRINLQNLKFVKFIFWHAFFLTYLISFWKCCVSFFPFIEPIRLQLDFVIVRHNNRIQILDKITFLGSFCIQFNQFVYCNPRNSICDSLNLIKC